MKKEKKSQKENSTFGFLDSQSRRITPRLRFIRSIILSTKRRNSRQSIIKRSTKNRRMYGRGGSSHSHMECLCSFGGSHELRMLLLYFFYFVFEICWPTELLFYFFCVSTIVVFTLFLVCCELWVCIGRVKTCKKQELQVGGMKKHDQRKRKTCLSKWSNNRYPTLLGRGEPQTRPS